MVIEIDLSDADMQKANRKLNDYIKSIPKRADRLGKRLAELGQKAALGAYGNDIPVTITPIDSGYVITAYGKAVCFLEFGAGTMTDTANEYAAAMPFSVTPGSWSSTHAKMFSTKGYWVFGGKKYTFVKPRRGMWTAAKAITQDVTKIAAEVFGKQ